MRHNGAMSDERHPRSVGGSARGRHTLSRRVRDMVAAAVQDEVYPLNEKLIEEVLVESLGASRNAVREALQHLAKDGILDRHTRSGTTVASNKVRLRMHDIVGESDESRFTLRIVDRGEVAAVPMLLRRLEIDEPTVMMDELVFYFNAEPIGVRTTYYQVGKSTFAPVESGDMRRVAREYFGVELGDIETEIGSTLADDRTGKLLGAPEGSAVVVRQQLVRDVDGVPIEVVFDHFRADRVSFIDG